MAQMREKRRGAAENCSNEGGQASELGNLRRPQGLNTERVSVTLSGSVSHSAPHSSQLVVIYLMTAKFVIWPPIRLLIAFTPLLIYR
jgi:hypothetical protein